MVDPRDPYSSYITSDKLVLGCKLTPLPSRFLATTALISSSKPLPKNLDTVALETEQQ
jgi:hypothetical protein